MRVRRLRSYAVPQLARVFVAEADEFALDAARGLFVVAGQDAGLRRTRLMGADAGAFTTAGQAAALFKGVSMQALAGAYTLVGQDVAFMAPKRVTGDPGAFTVAGQAASLVRSLRVAGDAGSFSSVGQDAALTYTPGSNTASFITSSTVDSATITMPTVQTGDFVFLGDMANKTDTGSTQSTPVTPSGFTPLVLFPVTGDQGGATTNNAYAWAFGRIVTDGATESGSTITGSNLGSGGGNKRKTLMVFRGTIPFSSFAVKAASKVWSAGDPAPTSTSLTLGSAPFIAFGNYRAPSALVSPTSTPAFDGNVDNGTTARNSYKIYNSPGSGTLSIDMGDAGTANVLTSFLVELT